MDDVKADSLYTDSLYKTIPSVATDKGWYVHARGDHPEIRAKFFELIRRLNGYKAHVVIAKKDFSVFKDRYNSDPIEFYFDVLHHLLDGKLQHGDSSYKLYLSQRGNNSLHRFEKAVTKALKANDLNSVTAQCNLEIVPGKEMPELSIVDYLIWAVQRKLLTGESRYFDAMRDKFETITNLYGEGVK